METGLLRFEAYRVIGEDALIIHLTRGTAEKHNKDIDKEASFFRGPVAWTIRTCSKFLHLPATYSSQGSNFTRPGGGMSGSTSDGTTA